MLGVIIGVVSVVTTVSLGEGVKQQIRQQSHNRGDDLLTILPGQRVERDKSGKVIKVNPTLFTSTVLNEIDYRNVQKSEGVGKTAPIAEVIGLAKSDEATFEGQIIATSGSLAELLNQKVAYGSFFSELDPDTNYAVIGSHVAQKLFLENVPMGKSFTVRGQTFIVRGIFDDFPEAGPLAFDIDYNNTIFIPYDVGRELMGGTIAVQKVLAKPADGARTSDVAAHIRQTLLQSHAGQEDFTVLTLAETLLVASSLLNLLTAMIAGIAAISLFVGGIGIMNIMFVSVTERTSEIGIRKAVGATNRQIMNQFITEATILSLVGGLAGVLLSILINFILRVTTHLQPVITLPIMGIAVAMSILVGIIFGSAPALRAARKNPIDALRYE
jgi:ABC-type antimicrobial peptide transport system permease subunit